MNDHRKNGDKLFQQDSSNLEFGTKKNFGMVICDLCKMTIMTER